LALQKAASAAASIQNWKVVDEHYAVGEFTAILGRSGRQFVLHLSAIWGGLAKHKPLLDAILGWRNSSSPKLIPPEDQVACAHAEFDHSHSLNLAYGFSALLA
jgi:hypothetical protein